MLLHVYQFSARGVKVSVYNVLWSEASHPARGFHDSILPCFTLWCPHVPQGPLPPGCLAAQMLSVLALCQGCTIESCARACPAAEMLCISQDKQQPPDNFAQAGPLMCPRYPISYNLMRVITSTATCVHIANSLGAHISCTDGSLFRRDLNQAASLLEPI